MQEKLAHVLQEQFNMEEKGMMTSSHNINQQVINPRCTYTESVIVLDFCVYLCVFVSLSVLYTLSQCARIHHKDANGFSEA